MKNVFGTLVALTCFAAAAGATALVVLLTHGASSMWVLLIVLAGLAALTVVWSGDLTTSLLCGVVFTAPVAITKSLSAPGGVYAPGLELSLVDVFLGALLCVWLVNVMLQRSRVHLPPPGAGVVLAIGAWAWTSALLAGDRTAGVLAAVNQTKFLLEFVAIYNLVTTPAVLRRVLTAAGAGLVLNLLMVAGQTATGSALAIQGAKASSIGVEVAFAAADGLRAFRPSGFLLHPNPFADYLVIVLPVLLVLTLSREPVPPAWRWSCTALAGGGVLALVLTLSRGGWISFAVAMAFALVVGVRRRLLPTSRVAALAAVAVVAIGMMVIARPAVLYRLIDDDSRSTETRWLMIDQAALIIRDHALFGVGLGNYTRASQRYTPESFASISREYQESIRAGVVHNGYLLLWAERGIVGLLLQVSIVATALVRFYRNRQWFDPALHAIALGLAAGVVGQATFYLFDHFYLDLRPGVFWLLLGLTASVLRMRDGQAQRLAPLAVKVAA